MPSRSGTESWSNVAGLCEAGRLADHPAVATCSHVTTVLIPPRGVNDPTTLSRFGALAFMEKVLDASGLALVSGSTMADAAQKIVKLVA